MKKNSLNARYLKTQCLLLRARLESSAKLDKETRQLLKKLCSIRPLPKTARDIKPADDEIILISQDPVRFYEEQLAEILAQAKRERVPIPLEKICARHRLNEAEKNILLLLFFAELNSVALSGSTILKLIALDIEERLVTKLHIILRGSKLRSAGLIRSKHYIWSFFTEWDKLSDEYKITDELFWEIAGIPRKKHKEKPRQPEITDDDDPPETSDKNPEIESAPPKSDKESSKKERQESRLLQISDPTVTFDMLVLPENTISQIEQALWQFLNGERVYQEYGIADKIPYGKAVAMLLSGPPGTGKTATAEAIAHKLGKKIGYVSYPQIYSKWFGESEKFIHQVFEDATTAGCVLLFDEADACFGTRFETESHSVDRTHNIITNVLMQEVERFTGLLILTTNRAPALDPAFERRILLHLQFDLPGPEERTKIWRLLLKDCKKLAPDVDFEQLGTRYQLTGAQIKNAVMKAVTACARQSRPITMADLEKAINDQDKKDKKMLIGFRHYHIPHFIRKAYYGKIAAV
ncbi:ATP-binding protein [candidate division WOR-3 bacterium]|nr:ATP-binding protein [candidate division WOR-3 bacterium]